MNDIIWWKIEVYQIPLKFYGSIRNKDISHTQKNVW